MVDNYLKLTTFAQIHNSFNRVYFYTINYVYYQHGRTKTSDRFVIDFSRDSFVLSLEFN